MNLQKTYPSLLAADLAAAEGWYTKLLGGPDHRPMPTLLHWELSDEGGLMLSSSEEIAARGAICAAQATLPARMTVPTSATNANPRQDRHLQQWAGDRLWYPRRFQERYAPNLSIRGARAE